MFLLKNHVDLQLVLKQEKYWIQLFQLVVMRMKILWLQMQGEICFLKIYLGNFISPCRIRSETDGWCPFNKISSTTYEYLQIDLINLTVITLIELQGKFSSKPVNKL